MKPTLLIIILSLVACVTSQTRAQLDPTALNNKKEAERIWELAIEAKGGRQRLYSVSNVLMSSTSRYYYGLKKVTNLEENLFVFPDKWWFWDDNRPSKFGLRMSMYNWQIGKKYVMQFEGNPFNGLEPIEPNQRSTGFAGLIDLFLETKWNRPQPVRTFTAKVGSTKVDVVETKFMDDRADFYFDGTTRLLVKAIFYSNGKPSNTTRFSDYIDVDGLKMPSKKVLEASDGEFEHNVTFKFNVDYEESIFVKPPPFEAGPEAWKKKN